MPSLTSLHPARLNVPSLSSPERKSSTARSPSNLPASLSQPARRPKVLPAEVRALLEARAVVVDHLAVDVVADVAVEDEVAVLLVV